MNEGNVETSELKIDFDACLTLNISIKVTDYTVLLHANFIPP